MRYGECDVAVIGGGPAGLAAATAAAAAGVSVCLFEREEKVGGILKQCIHDGFGLIRYGEKLSGPEYAYREEQRFRASSAQLRTETFMTAVEKENNRFLLTLTDSEGILKYHAKALIVAGGCRERTDRQVGIHGFRPAGVFTAGQAQAYVNLDGRMPARRCVILGSGDIGLIMARRMTLEGSEVVGVYEIKHEAAGLSRNIAQCLTDFSIPLHLGCTVTKVVGRDRVEAVWTTKVDEKLSPIAGTEELVECDTLILSVGLIPENDAFDSLGWQTDSVTGGPRVDSCGMTSVVGVFSCGNSLHVNDLVDYVSESGETAGNAAAAWVRRQLTQDLKTITVKPGSAIGSLVPQSVALDRLSDSVDFFFRSRKTLSSCRLSVTANGKEIFEKRYETVRPPEMEKVTLAKSLFTDSVGEICFSLLPDEKASSETAEEGVENIDELVCIECPRGCRLKLGRREDGTLVVSGNSCPKGKLYGEKELEDPRRVLTTTVKTVFENCPRLAVRTDGGIPLSALKEAAEMTSQITVREAAIPGTVLVNNFGGWGVNLIAASECHSAGGNDESQK